MAGSVISHKGLVKEVTDNFIIVSILNHSACSSCHAAGACSVADLKEKEIEIPFYKANYSPGDEVTVLFKESAGFTALFFGYVFPFIIVLITLITMFSVTGNEGVSGLLAIGVLIPYYITLYFLRHYLKKVFKFELQ